MSDEKLLTAPELAQHLGVCVATVYRNAERGAYPFFKIGGVFRFRLSDVLNATKSDYPELAPQDKAALAAKED